MEFLKILKTSDYLLSLLVMLICAWPVLTAFMIYMKFIHVYLTMFMIVKTSLLISVLISLSFSVER